jgi:hypothetical protein
MGNLDQYMKLKVANSIDDAAKNNGNAGAGLGLGLEMAIYYNKQCRPNSLEEQLTN